MIEQIKKEILLLFDKWQSIFGREVVDLGVKQMKTK